MASAKTIIENFEEAVREHAFRGAQMPESHAETERFYAKSKVALLKLCGVEITRELLDDLVN